MVAQPHPLIDRGFQKLNQMATDIEFQLDKMEMSESGLVLKHIDKLKFNYDKYNPTRGGSYIELPEWLKLKRACINIQNQDDTCFMYSIQCGVCKVYEKDHPNRIYKYKNLKDDLNWDNVNFPASNFDIDILEQNNEGKVSVNVYYIDDEDGKQSILLYKRTTVVKATHHIDLLKITDGDNHHYVYIKDFNKLMYQQAGKRKAKKFICHHCSGVFHSEDDLTNHKEKGCMAVEGQTYRDAKV